MSVSFSNLIRPLQECSGVFSFSRIKVQATQVEKDVGFETLFASIAVSFFDEPLDFVVQPLNRTIGEAMHKKGQNVSQVSLAHPRYLLDRCQSAPNRPTIPFLEIPLCFLHLVAQPETSEHLFNHPGARSLQVEFFDRLESLGVLGG